jgi:hypothetical protein
LIAQTYCSVKKIHVDATQFRKMVIKPLNKSPPFLTHYLGNPTGLVNGAHGNCINPGVDERFLSTKPSVLISLKQQLAKVKPAKA